MLSNPYFYGFIALLIIYFFSVLFTKSWWPWALANGYNGKLSASQIQFFIFTLVTIFSYVTVFAARLINLDPSADFPSLPVIPANLLVLMGLSVATTVSSKAISISYLEQRRLPQEDQSTLTKNREGDTDLIKVQMLIWTVIAAIVYIIRITRFIANKEFIPVDPTQGLALPDIDGALLVLMGLAEGGYVGGKLVGRSIPIPVIESIIPTKIKTQEEVNILGYGFGVNKEGNSIVYKDSGNNEGEIPADKILEWTDTKIRFVLPDKLAPTPNHPTDQIYSLKIRSSAQMGEAKGIITTL